MRDKNKRGDQEGGGGGGGRIRGARKNIVGSDSQMLLQSAASAGFIGFSAFRSQSSPSVPAVLDAAGSPESGLTGKGADGGGGKGQIGQVFKAAGVYGIKSGPSQRLQVLPPHYSGGDSHLAMVSKRLAKRDVTTKIKALAELRAMCRLVTPDSDSVSTPQLPARRSRASPNPTVPFDSAQTSSGTGDTDVGSTGKFSTGAVTMGIDEGSVVTSAEALGGFAPHWVFLYQRLSTEGDRRTREAANTTLHCMMKANRRAFQPLLRSLLGPWCCSQADTAAEVSYAAKEAYEAVFPEAKRTSVLGRCADGVLRYLATTLQQTPAMLEETSGCTPEEAEMRAERLTVSALSALANFMETVGAESNQRLSLPGQDGDSSDKVDDGVVVAEQEKKATYWHVANDNLWSRLGDPRPTVRRATYALVSSCCRNAAGLLRPRPLSDTTASTADEQNPGDVNLKEHAHGTGVSRNKDMPTRPSRVATPALLVNFLSEQEVSNHREAWQAALFVLQEFKDTWRAEKGAEMVLPTLLSRLRNGSFLTSSRTSYPCLLPFIATLSLETLRIPAGARVASVHQNKEQIAKTICSTSSNEETAFCVEFLEAVSSPLARLSSPGRSGEWLVDVASAHVECAAFLLLKLPPLAASGTAAEDPSALAAVAAITAFATSLARAMRSFVLDHKGDELAEADETHEKKKLEVRPVGLRKMLRNAEDSTAVSDAFGRALGQLHLGAERGAGMMGTLDGSTTVWEALLQECMRALGQRSRDGVQWMSDTLVYALEVVNARHDAVSSRSASTADGSTPETASPRLSGRDGGTGDGVFDLCRALFRYCVWSLWESSGGETVGSDKEGEFQAAITQLDVPLVTFMASMARALGLRNSLLPARSALMAKEARIPATFNSNGREFYENLLVPWFAATAAQAVVSIDGSAEGVEAGWEADTTAQSGLQELAQIHLTESDHGDEDFKLLVQRALLQPPQMLLEATTTTLRLVPIEFSEFIPELEDVLLAACGLATTADLSPTAQPSTSFPLFLRACLGVWDSRTASSPFIRSSAVVRIADAAIATASSLVYNNVLRVPAAPPAASSVRMPNQALALMVMDGLLGVLAARRVPPSTSSSATTTNSQQALNAIDERWLGLLLAAFHGCGEGGSAERLWRDSGLPALEHILAASATSLHKEDVASSSSKACRGAWQAFLEGAVDFTRWVMEGDENNDDFVSGGDVSVMEAAERAATLTLALTKIEERLVPESARNDSKQDAEAGEIFLPVLWRLGLTQPAVWQRRRTEALAGAATAPAAELACACVSSRWGRRWACLSVILNRIPSARSRLVYFLEGVRGVRGVASLEAECIRNLCGKALQEAVAAGVVTSAAIRLLRSERIDSPPTTGPDDELAELKWDDLPPGLEIAPPPLRTGKFAVDAGSGNRGSDASAGEGSRVLADFGVGLPSWRGLAPSAGAPAALAAGVMGAALTHLADVGAAIAPGFSALSSAALVSSGDGEKLGDVEVEARTTTGVRARRCSSVAATAAIKNPFSLLIPTDLWPVAFEPLKVDRPVSDVTGRLREGSLKQPGSPKPLKPAGSLSTPQLVGSKGSRSVGNIPVVAASLGADDVRLHALLVSAFSSAAGAMTDGATVEIRGDKAAAWWMSCAVEVTAGLLTSVVGEAFSLGLGLGAEANRLMAIRCGIYKPSALIPADLVPGAKILETREGQAVTVVAAHDDDGSGEPYYTVRPVAVAGSNQSTWQEKQTVLDRLFLSPLGVENADSSVLEPCPSPWRVKPAVSSALARVVEGPLLAIERSLRRSSRLSSSDGSGMKSPVLATAAGAALRSCASTCVRALLLCSDGVGAEPDFGNGDAKGGTGMWDRVEPKIIELRNWWASAAVVSGSRLLVASAADDGSEESAQAVSLCTVILSGFLAGTPLITADEPALKLLPARLEAALCGEAATDVGSAARIGSGDSPGHGDSSVRTLTVPTHGWRRTQALSSLQWMRDATDASCKIHLCPSQASVEGVLFSDTQTAIEAAVVALVRASLDNGWGGGALDLALARAASGLFAAEAVRVGRGKGVSLSSESKAAVISWAVSKFLFSGSRIAARSGRSGADVGIGASPRQEDELALCLESARLLTATAWDGRKGWGGDGSVALPAPARKLVAGPREVSEIWAAARAPATWCGLHAAVVGAVDSPTIQMCAFEVLEAAAAGWECAEIRGTNDDRKDEDTVDLVGAGEHDLGEDVGQAQPAEGTEGGQSIVSRLAAALGGWGLAAIRSGGSGSGAAATESGGSGGGGFAEPSAGEHDGDLPGADAVREEAQEQQNDLELVARCFPEDLLLAVEAIPTTIEFLRRDSRQKPARMARTNSNSHEEGTSDETAEDEDEGFDDGETEGDIECLEDDQDTDNDEAETVVEQHEQSNVNGGDNSGDDDTEQERAHESQDLPQVACANTQQPSGRSKSRRLRQRKRSETNFSRRSESNLAGSRGRTRSGQRNSGQRNSTIGPPLTAPFLTWLLWLEHCRRASEAEKKSRVAARAFVVRAGALKPVLDACVRVLRALKAPGTRGNAAMTRLGPAQAIRVSCLDPTKPLDLARLALAVYFRTVHVFPALTRSWWADDCVREMRVWVAEFTQRHVSPALIQIEADTITDATSRGICDEGGEMTVRASATSRQVVASYIKEECTLEACIQLPPEYPLRSVEVTCSRRMGVSKTRWRHWVLQIVTLLSLQDGSVLDAVMLWKKNVDKEFEGVEPCVICHGILHPRDMARPQMSCKTCKNWFHSTCLYKWFHTSRKSKCPICQQTWA